MSEELEGRLDDVLDNEVEPGEGSGEWEDVVPMPSGENEPMNHNHQLSGDKPANA